MSHLFENKHILLGVTGSIAAYKAIDLASKLKQLGAVLDVVLTESALKFVSALSFQSVTGRKAFTDADLWGGEGHVVHVSLGHAAELVVIAPASANTISKLANGSADNLLTDAVLVSDCPLVIAPAMESHMYAHVATQANISTLEDRGVIFLGPTEGHLASGALGKGRFMEPTDILAELRMILARKGALAQKKITITAGGTQEAIDPVRLITNRSSGKQGFAAAQAALDAGAEVTLITAPTFLSLPFGVKYIPVHSAAEMQKAVLENIQDADALIMAAAVADFRPKTVSDQKIKKSEGLPQIILESTTDILKEVAKVKKRSGFPRLTIGFAAESQDLVENARQKLAAKDLDLIVANDISRSDAGFEVDTNAVTLIDRKGRAQSMPVMAKTEVAEKVIAFIIHQLGK